MERSDNVDILAELLGAPAAPEPPLAPKKKGRPTKADQKARLDAEVEKALAHRAAPKPPDDALPSLRKRLDAYRNSEILRAALERQGFDFARAERSKTSEELEAELTRAEGLLGRHQSQNLADQLALGALGIAEGVAVNKAGIEVQGLTAACWQDPDWRFTLERVKVKHGLGDLAPELDPLTQLLFSTMSIAATLRAKNTATGASVAIAAKLDEPAEE